MAKLSDARRRPTPRELRRPGLATAAVLVVLFHVFLAAAEPVDTLLARAGSRTISASDVALARALGVLGFAPSASPIERSDVDRYVDALLMLEEAGRIGIEVEPAAIDAAWVAVGIRAGGEAALERWLQDNAIDRDWARRLVAEDLVKSKFLDARFAAFVFPDEEAITRELGPGQHDEAAREQARERLVRQAASEAQATWLADARRRASIRILLPAGSSVAPPFVLP
ncbi:MAG TPA: hypothetical protein VET45_17820 [Candidatus Binatia bacterium]|nr:hypothetical protein [Candidatus Binatia bacterium]